MSLPLRHPLENVSSLDRVFEDLLVRFVINCPPEDLSSVERELFHFEEASWFYTDFIKLMNPTLPSLKIKSFAKNIIRLCPLVWKWDIHADEALQKFSQYKKSIPVRGAAIFNEKLSKILLVQGTESDSWSFPRGKISKDEDDVACCVREVREEIGFDLTDYIDENQFIERNIQGKNYKIFIISGVPEDYNFKPQVRNEIEKIEWRDFKKIQKSMNKPSAARYYLMSSMMRPLSMWVRRQKGIIGDDQLKQYAEDQLKLLLGITKEEQVDPGRELLNVLHSAVQNREENRGNINVENRDNTKETLNLPLTTPPVINQLTFPQILSPNIMGLHPFAPFPFMNGNGNVPPFVGPHRASDILQIGQQQQQQQQQQQCNGPGVPPPVIPTPDVSLLSRPAFTEEESRQNHQGPISSSRQLLDLLNSKNQSGQQGKRSETSSSSHEDDSTSESAAPDLLRILKNREPDQELLEPSHDDEKSSSQDIYEDFESSSDDGEQDSQEYDMDESKSKSESDGYEDFESDVDETHFSEPAPPAKTIVRETVKKEVHREVGKVEKSREIDHNHPMGEQSSSPSKNTKPKPKFKLLKRGENLADVLPQQSSTPSAKENSPSARENSPSSESLLSLFKNPSHSKKSQVSLDETYPKRTGDFSKQASTPKVDESPSHLSEASIVEHHQEQNDLSEPPHHRQSTGSTIRKLQQSPEEGTFTPEHEERHQEHLVERQNDARQLLAILRNRHKGNPVGSPFSGASSSPENVTNTIPAASSDSHLASSELLDILRRPMNSDSQSPSQIPYGSMVDSFKGDSSYASNSSNELLGILHRK